MDGDSEIKIEKGVPIRGLRAGYSKYPARKMEIGDSFYVPRDLSKTIKNHRNNVFASCRQLAPTFKFSSSVQGDGVRIWRIA